MVDRAMTGLAVGALVVWTSCAARADDMLSWPGFSDPLVMTAVERPGSATRADLAQAYRRFERAWFEKKPEGEMVAEMNRRFDRATTAFFSQRGGEAIRTLNEMDWGLRQGGVMPTDLEALATLRVRAFPRVWVPSINTPLAGPVLRIDSLYDAEREPLRLDFVVRVSRAGGEAILLERRVRAEVGDDRFVSEDVPLGPQFAGLPPGAYDISVALPGRDSVPVDAIFVAPMSLDALREELVARSYNIIGPDEAPPQPLWIFRARAGLLSDAPSLDRSVGFMFNPLVLAGQLQAEWGSIDDAGDPYFRRVGDVWRSLRLEEGRSVPMRVYAPEPIVRGFALPLVIALHGAGGDENMFMDAYGAGELVRLADEMGFIAASPSTLALANGAENLDRLVADLAQDYPIDQTRVYVLGHSLGAVATTRFAAARGDRIAAAACIAGFTPFPDGSAPCPTLVVGAALDPIFSVDRLRAGVEAATQSGHPVEWREVQNAGHTLVVTTELRSVIEWLLLRSASRAYLDKPDGVGGGAGAAGPRP